MFDAAANAPANKRYDAVRDAILNLRKEHRLFIEKAVEPAFLNNPATNWIERRAALNPIPFVEASDIPGRVDQLRQETVEKVLQELQASELLTEEEVDKLLQNHSICKCVY